MVLTLETLQEFSSAKRVTTRSNKWSRFVGILEEHGVPHEAAQSYPSYKLKQWLQKPCHSKLSFLHSQGLSDLICSSNPQFLTPAVKQPDWSVTARWGPGISRVLWSRHKYDGWDVNLTQSSWNDRASHDWHNPYISTVEFKIEHLCPMSCMTSSTGQMMHIEL